MSWNQALLAAALTIAFVCSNAVAGDFVPRATNSFAAVGDDPGSRASCPDGGSGPAMNETDPSVHSSPGPASAPVVTPSRSAKHIGIDDAAVDTHAATATTTDGDEKPVPASAHKSRSGLRWQSLLPGIMK